MSRLATVLFGPTTEADERHLGNILRQETAGGLLMMAAAAIALIWANISPTSYQSVSQTHIGPLSIAHWMSDGLLTIFFFVAGLELKREFVEGSLRRPASALVPIVAAICGMAVPAIIYTLINLAPGGVSHGWAIPMATDIAFAVAVLSIVGSQLPPSIRSFLLTLAIVDDLGAIIIIAIFYAGSMNWLALAGAFIVIAAWGILQHFKVRSPWIYAPLGIAAWWLMHASGIHATIAGVALGLLVRTKLDEDDDTLDVWQNAPLPWSAGLVVPLFALFSAGVTLDASVLSTIFTSPVPLGILAGLVLGKLVGVFCGSRITARITNSQDDNVNWIDVAGTAQLAGIGFTVSLLLVELTFADQPEHLAQGKAAVLMASLISAIIGGIVLRRRNHKHAALIS